VSFAATAQVGLWHIASLRGNAVFSVALGAKQTLSAPVVQGGGGVVSQGKKSPRPVCLFGLPPVSRSAGRAVRLPRGKKKESILPSFKSFLD
jgi:hypothetical protein